MTAEELNAALSAFLEAYHEQQGAKTEAEYMACEDMKLSLAATIIDGLRNDILTESQNGTGEEN